MEVLKRLGYFIYAMDPRDHNYEKLEDVKDYYKEVTNLIVITIFIEQAVRYCQKKPMSRLNDALCNVFHGFLMELSKIPLKGTEVFVYSWIYNNYRIMTLPWDSPWTWILCWILTDYFYYWMHRMSHQVNILWAIHETHHSPEDITFHSSLRSHMLLIHVHWLTYLPMAFAIPPTTYLVHYQINIIYQYWLHSEIIFKLPKPIEFLFCTPSHHRAHHGRNRRYIDKNFGGFLIIWDRLFGTFEEEDPDEKPVYGVTTQMDSFNPFVIQTRHFRHIFKKFREYENIGDKLSVIFKGPGWSPGKPWVGNLEDIPHPTPLVEKYYPILPGWCWYYIIIHYIIFLNGYLLFVLHLSILSKMTVIVGGLFLAYSCISLSSVLDKSMYAMPFELIRCLAYFLVDRMVFPEIQQYGLVPVISTFANRVVFLVTLVIWVSGASHVRRLKSSRKAT